MKSLTLGLLRLYKRWISPMLPHACRFVPTCSEYTLEAVSRYGALKGLWLGAGRLLRCQPLARAGYDPVPSKSSICFSDNAGPASTTPLPEPMSR